MTTPDRTAARVLEVFGLYGQIDWARMSLGGEEQGPTIPVVVWRFEDPDSQSLPKRLNELVGSNWVLERGGRNWILWPKALAHAFSSGRWRTDTDAALALASSDPELAGSLAEEFWKLIATLEGEDA